MVLVCREDGRKSRRSGLVFATVGPIEFEEVWISA